MIATSRCFETIRGLRCELERGHGPEDEPIHRNTETGETVTWGARDIPRPAWMGHAKAKDITARA